MREVCLFVVVVVAFVCLLITVGFWFVKLDMNIFICRCISRRNLVFVKIRSRRSGLLLRELVNELAYKESH